MNLDGEFIKFCMSGDLAKAKSLYDKKRANPYAYGCTAFIRSCSKGKLDVVIWLDSICNIRRRVYTKALKEAFTGGHINVINWLYEKDPNLDIGIYDIEAIFKKCCMAGGTEAAELLYSKYESSCTGMNINDTLVNCCISGNVDLFRRIYNENITTQTMEEGYIAACGKGHIDIILLIVELKPNINIHAQQDRAFRESCAAGEKDIAELLFELGGVNIHADNDDAFKRACLNNHLDIARWIQSKGDVKYDRYLFRDVCWAGHKEVAEFLYSINKKAISMHPKEYVSIIYRGHTDVAAMVYKLGKINIRRSSYGMLSPNVDDDGLYIFACTSNKVDMVKWMMTICDKYHAVIDNNKVIKWWIDDKIILAKINNVTKKIIFTAHPKTDNKKYVVLYNAKVKVSDD